MTLSNILEKYVKAHFCSPDTPIYHYTSSSNFDQILNDQYLKLNPHRLLNKKDNNELKMGVDIILTMLKKYKLCYLIHKFKKYIDEYITFYTVSFSQEANSDYALKKYGSRYIEFNSKFLHQFATRNHSTLLGTVIYEKKLQDKIISDIFGLFEQYKNSTYEPEVDLFTWLTVAIPLLKEEKHQKDDECRIVGAEILYNGELITPVCPKKLPFTDKDIKCS